MHILFCDNPFDNKPDYWEEGEYSAAEDPPLDIFRDVAKNIESNFFSMDIAKTKNGDWIILELGDGQVAGLPHKADRQGFYELVRQQSTRERGPVV